MRIYLEDGNMKCKWCNKQSSGSFCSTECKESYERFEEYANRYGLLFYIGCLAPAVLAIGAIFTKNVALWIGLILLVEGITITVFPFGTPQSNEALGVKKP